jgi:hypothetical protein
MRTGRLTQVGRFTVEPGPLPGFGVSRPIGFHAASCCRCRSSLSVQPGTLPLSQRFVAPASYTLASSLAT